MAVLFVPTLVSQRRTWLEISLISRLRSGEVLERGRSGAPHRADAGQHHPLKCYHRIFLISSSARSRHANSRNGIQSSWSSFSTASFSEPHLILHCGVCLVFYHMIDPSFFFFLSHQHLPLLWSWCMLGIGFCLSSESENEWIREIEFVYVIVWPEQKTLNYCLLSSIRTRVFLETCAQQRHIYLVFDNFSTWSHISFNCHQAANSDRSFNQFQKCDSPWRLSLVFSYSSANYPRPHLSRKEARSPPPARLDRVAAILMRCAYVTLP